MYKARRTGRSAAALLGVAVLALVVAAWSAATAQAAAWKTYVRKGAIADTLLDLETAIINRGLTIDYIGDIGSMLDRTGADVGSTQKLYVGARTFMFCSAKYSRLMMEADPANLGYCPFIVFAYERADRPGEVTAGFRTLGPGSNEAATAAIGQITELLDEIVRDAME